MKSSVQLDQVHYGLHLDGEIKMELNPCLGSEVILEWTGDINCINCGRPIKKTFGQGFCYPCFREAPAASPCVLRPELCEAHLGKGRDPEWEEANHNQPHTVYLAQTSDVKVGVTRNTQVPTRWIDQGAWQALPIAETPYRQLAGLIELEIKQYISDRTDWRAMLKGINGTTDLYELRDTVLSFLPEKLAIYARADAEIRSFQYPVSTYPKRVVTHDLNASPVLKGTLSGIRGQYLILDEERVINLRKYSGYRVTFTS